MIGLRLCSNSWDEYSDKKRKNNIFPFGVLDQMRDLIVAVPHHCLFVLFYVFILSSLAKYNAKIFILLFFIIHMYVLAMINGLHDNQCLIS